MPIEINGVPYVSLAELAAETGVARQTLWRWRQEAHIPAGYRFRGRAVLFTADEAQAVRAYAFRLEPAATPRHKPSARRQISEETGDER